MKELNSQMIQKKLRSKFLKLGVKMMGSETIFFSKDTKIGKNVIIEPYVVFGLKVKIGNNVTIKSFSHLENCRVENKVNIGPFARIRPGSILKEGSKVGNFVEIKESIIGKKSKVNHLTYIGDSDIGKSVNVGAGTITCNYDGTKKNKTIITLATLLLRVVEADKEEALVVVLVELIFQIYLKIFLEILVVDNQGEEEKPIIEVLIFDMIYLLPLKKHMRVKNKI